MHLQDLLLQISRDQKRTIVFVTHDADEAIYLADRIIVFSTADNDVQTVSIDVPFKKPRVRQQLFNTREFVEFREQLFTIMNQQLLETFNKSAQQIDGQGI